MRGKFTTKTIIIAVITLIVLIAAVTGTVVFLKDSGEAAAAQEQEIINDIQQDKAEENSDDTVKEEQNLPELGNEDEQNDNNEGNTNNNNSNNQNANNNNGNNQNTNNNGNLEEPAPSTVEREKVISETTTLGWKNIGLNQSVNANDLFINYNNLKYKVEYYFDGNIEESSTITVGENSKGKVINTYEERNKVGYKLGKVENLPLTITENENENVIKVHYIKDEEQTKEISYTVKYYLDNAEQEKDRKVEKETVWINAEETMTFNTSLLNKEYTGYKKVKTNPETIGTTVKNKDVIEVYYEKDTSITKEISYTVKYYLDNVEQEKDRKVEKETVWINAEETMTFNTSLLDKKYTGYKKVKTNPETIGTTVKNKDVIEVYYEKDEEQTKEISYTVKYYLDNAEQEKDRKVEKETVWINAEETMTFNTSLLNKEYTGYKKVKTNPETIGTTVKNKDVIEVYYEKDTSKTKEISYTVKYYLDNVEQEKDRKVEKETVWINAEETMTFNSSLLNKEYIGYKKVKTNPETIGTTVKNKDVIEVYYEKENSESPKISYTIYYYKDSVDGANLLGRIPGTAEYKTKITADVTKFKPIEGYEFIGNVPSMIIDTDSTKNKLNVVYTKLSNLSYTIEYLEKGTNKELKTITISNQKYNDTIKIADISIPKTLTVKGKEYKYSNKYSPEAGKITITTDSSKNIIKLYYERPEIKSEKTSKVTTTAIKAGTAHPGDEITYTIKVWNEGSGAKEVTIVDNKPQGTTIKADSASANGGTVTATDDKITWKVNVPENTSKTNAKVLTFKAIIANDATGTIKNTATIDGSKGPNDGDGFKVVKPSDITVSKTSSNTSGEVKYGDEITYTLKAKNNGEESGTVTIKDSDIKELIDNKKVELISSSVDIEKLATGFPVTVNVGETKQITYKVKVIANVAVNIKNRIEVTNGGKVDDNDNEVEVNTVKYVTVNKLTETTTPKNIIIAIDKSGSMIGEDHIKAKKAVQNIIDVIYPNNTSFANNLINTKVIAYAGIKYFGSIDSCSTIGSASNYEDAKDLKNKVGLSVASGELTNLKNTLKYLAKQVDTNVSKENNIIIFVGDGGTGIAQGVKWADCINASNALKAISTVFTVDVGNADTMKNMASSSDKYSKVNGYNTDGLTQALKKIIDTVTLNTETDSSRKTDNNGYVKLENIDINRAITINSTTYTSKPDCIILQDGKYYLDLKQFGANEKVSITYYKK